MVFLLPLPASASLCARARRLLTRGVLLAAALLPLSGCTLLSRDEVRPMMVTAYCGCGECNSYSRGTWKFLKLDVWNKTVNAGPDKGRKYTGETAAGDSLKAPRPGLVSTDSVRRPWMIPARIIFPWCIVPRDGTIAADTSYYPFGTRMYIPGWGWGTVTDRGGAIKGPDHIDIFMNRHSDTERWGKPTLNVRIVRR